MDKTKNDDGLHHFKETGFFEEREAALQHLRDADDILFAKGVDYCVMFGTLKFPLEAALTYLKENP